MPLDPHTHGFKGSVSAPGGTYHFFLNGSHLPIGFFNDVMHADSEPADARKGLKHFKVWKVRINQRDDVADALAYEAIQFGNARYG